MPATVGLFRGAGNGGESLEKKRLERAKGFEPSTPTLARLCSTPELRPRSRQGAVSRRLGPRLQVAPRRGMVCHNQAARLVSLRRSNIYALTDIEGYEPWTS